MIKTTLALAALLGLQACAQHGDHHHGMDMSQIAAASLSPSATSSVTGLVVFHAKGEDLMVHVQASGLAPNSTHGFHVHATGSCASADFMSAGGHFNPRSHTHGPQEAEHHAGDMPNLVADAEGKINQKFTLKASSLRGAQGVIGHAVIVHADADDFKTQPTGNSGARIACGVIAGH